MFQKFSNSWELVKASMRVLQADKELMVFPIISTIGAVIVTLTFIFPMILSNMFDKITGGGEVAAFLVGFLYYIVQYTVIFFANTALVGAAMIRLRGGDPTVRDGLNIAASRFGAILGYALIAATVGMILRAISQRGGIIGQIVASLFGLAWNIATFLVVPVLAIENVGPIDAVKRSVALLKKTWGEQIAGNLGFGAFFGLLTLGVFVVGIAGIILIAQTGSTALILAAICIFLLVLVMIGLVSSALSGIYTAAVYQYAMDGKVSGFFNQQMVENAFKQK